jgi:hypothetical protein
MMGRRKKGFSRIEPGALIGLAVLALAYWGTVATLIMARNTPTAQIELGPTTIRPEPDPAPRRIRIPAVRLPATRHWCFADAFNERAWYGQPRQIGLALQPPCSLPLRYGLIRSTRPDYGILINDTDRTDR